MAPIQKLLGDTVEGKDGPVPTASLFGEDRVLGLYFSAHWCPPCRGFTPELVTFYNAFRETEKGKNFEIVFVSSDKDEGAFKEYFAEMPWLALPFDQRDAKAKLSQKYKVQGIPSFVLVDGATGKTITADGRSKVSEDKEAKNFPWHPKPLSELLKGDLKRGKEETLEFTQATEGKITGIYFSAHWCPPCKAFTPKLCETYTKLKEAGKNFECIFASWDQSEDEFESYYAEMPFLAFPHEDDRIQALGSHFGVDGIPALVLLDENMQLISDSARGAISADPEGKNFPWLPQPLEELTGATASVINDSPTLLLLNGGGADQVEKSECLMKDMATDYLCKQKASVDKDEEMPELVFRYEGPNTGEMTKSLRDFAKLSDRTTQLVILDIGSQRKYEHPECEGGELTKEAVEQVVSDFKNDKLTWSTLKD